MSHTPPTSGSHAAGFPSSSRQGYATYAVGPPFRADPGVSGGMNTRMPSRSQWSFAKPPRSQGYPRMMSYSASMQDAPLSLPQRGPPSGPMSGPHAIQRQSMGYPASSGDWMHGYMSQFPDADMPMSEGAPMPRHSVPFSASAAPTPWGHTQPSRGGPWPAHGTDPRAYNPYASRPPPYSKPGRNEYAAHSAFLGHAPGPVYGMSTPTDAGYSEYSFPPAPQDPLDEMAPAPSDTGELRARRRAACRRHRSRMRDLFETLTDLVPTPFYIPSLQDQIETQFIVHYLPKQQPQDAEPSAKRTRLEQLPTKSLTAAAQETIAAAKDSPPATASSPDDSNPPTESGSSSGNDTSKGTDTTPPSIAAEPQDAKAPRVTAQCGIASTASSNSPSGEASLPPTKNKDDFKRAWGGEGPSPSPTPDVTTVPKRNVARPETPLPSQLESRECSDDADEDMAASSSRASRPVQSAAGKSAPSPGSSEYLKQLVNSYKDADVQEIFASLTRPTILGATIAYSQFLAMTESDFSKNAKAPSKQRLDAVNQ